MPFVGQGGPDAVPGVWHEKGRGVCHWGFAPRPTNGYTNGLGVVALAFHPVDHRFVEDDMLGPGFGLYIFGPRG